MSSWSTPVLIIEKPKVSDLLETATDEAMKFTIMMVHNLILKYFLSLWCVLSFRSSSSQGAFLMQSEPRRWSSVFQCYKIIFICLSVPVLYYYRLFLHYDFPNSKTYSVASKNFNLLRGEQCLCDTTWQSTCSSRLNIHFRLTTFIFVLFLFPTGDEWVVPATHRRKADQIRTRDWQNGGKDGSHHYKSDKARY